MPVIRAIQQPEAAKGGEMKNKGLEWLREVEQIGKDNGYQERIHNLVKAVRPFMRRSMSYRVRSLVLFKRNGMNESGLALLEMMLLAHEPGYRFRYNPELNGLHQQTA